LPGRSLSASMQNRTSRRGPAAVDRRVGVPRPSAWGYSISKVTLSSHLR
jgi:hypothetical protein